MACCSLRSVIAVGIIIGVLDIIHGLTTVGFYGYRYIANHFFLCPRDLDLTVCQNRLYIYEQMFTLRTIIGLGEGGITPIFAIIYIIALIKRQPWLTWFWLFKSFGVMGINVFYISSWMVRWESLEEITFERQEYQDLFLFFSIGLTLFQLAIMLCFCIVGAIFTYKVAEERTRSRRSLRSLHPRSPKQKKNGKASAPPLSYGSSYDEDEDDGETGSVVRLPMQHNHHFVNPALTDSTNKLPIPAGSNGSINSAGQADTLRQPTTV